MFRYSTVCKKEHIAVCYFEAWDIYSLEAVVESAELLNTPVIIGFGGVLMDLQWFDNGGLPDSENVQRIRQVVETAHAVGVGVEPELGTLPDASGEIKDDKGSLTDLSEAARFVAETGIDALSVSIGNVHVLTKGSAAIDFERVSEIHRKVDISLIIHGGSGFPEEAIPQAIALGVAKVNIGTVLKQTFFEGIRGAAAQAGENPNIQHAIGCRKPSDILQQGKLRMQAEVVRRLKLWSVK